MTQAKAAFLVKDPKKVEDPLSYRVLLILSGIYRRWASLRLRQMDDWVAQWALPEMFAGVQGRGAEDGWCGTPLDLEEAEQQGDDYTVGAADVFKCFDEVSHTFVYEVRVDQGVPQYLASSV